MNSHSKLDAFEIAKRLRSPCPPAVVLLDELDSTNAHALKMLAENSARAPFVLLARRQSAGRGRLGRKWFAAEGASVCMSVAVELGGGVENIESFTVRAGVEICEALRRDFNAEIFLKWPNDIYSTDGKKIAGMLAELKLGQGGSPHTVVFGIGLNFDLSQIDARSIPPEISEIVADLKSVSRADFTINNLAASVADAIVKTSENMDDQNLPIRFSKFDWLFGRVVNFNVAADSFTGVARGIDNAGHLILETGDGGRKSLHSGEATTKR